MTDPRVVSELERIARQHGGRLMPEAVVEAARNSRSILHSFFDWDNTEAAEKWRVHQARNLIRVTVTYIGENDDTPMRVFVSLHSDRQSKRGYQSTVNVLSDEDMRAELLEDALAELRAFREKYVALKELVAVFDAISKVEKKRRVAAGR